MTGPASTDPDATAEQLDEAARVVAAYAGELREAVASVRALVADVAADWHDPTGAGWVDRAELVRRDLERHADDAADLAARTARAAQDSTARAAQDSTAPAATGPAVATVGPVLAGTDARRVSPGTGMRIATLPDPPAR